MDREERILGELLTGARHLTPDSIALLRPEMFSRNYGNILEAFLEGERDMAKLARVGSVPLSEAMSWHNEYAFPDDVQAFIEKHYLDQIRGKADSIEGVQEMLNFLSEKMSLIRGVPDQANIIHEYEAFEKTYREGAKKGLLGLSTGLKSVDELTFGLIQSHVWVIGAYRGWGKSYAGINLANAVLEQGKPVVMFNLEMSNNETIQRLAGVRAKASPLEVLASDAEHVMGAKAEVLTAVDAGLLNLYDQTNEVAQMDAELFRLNAHGQIGLVVVDYIQLIVGRGSDYENLRDAARALQRMAKKYNTTVLIISQISNEAQKAGLDSNLDGFRGAGEIGQVANVAIRIYRERLDDKLAPDFKLHFTKVRHNKDGILHMVIDFPGGIIRERSTQEVMTDMQEKAQKQQKRKELESLI